MATVAFETALDFQHRLRILSNQGTAFESEECLLAEPEPAANDEFEPWELHSELVLVCPEVKKRALELLPERDPDAFLARARDPVFAVAACNAVPDGRLKTIIGRWLSSSSSQHHDITG